MTKSPTVINYDTQSAKSQDGTTPPIVQKLRMLFETIPEEELLQTIKSYYAGRNGYTNKVLWRTYVAMTVLNLPSFAELIRTLENNPFIASACGIANGNIPSKFAYSRFIHKLQDIRYMPLVKNIMRSLTRKCYERLPDFGKSIAIDSTDLKAWSNGSKMRKSDPDAGWVVKGDTHGKRKFVWGYKLNLLVDTIYEIPITATVTRGNSSDYHNATPLLSQARYTYSKFRPKYIICDAGYSSDALRRVIKKQWNAKPVIKAAKTHKKWISEETPEWQKIYDRRTAVERVFSRMKGHKRLNNITVRRKRKVTVHSLIPIIVTQAMALAFPDTPRNCVII